MQVFVAVTEEQRVLGSMACAVAHAGEGHLRGMAVLRNCKDISLRRAC